MKRVVLNFAIAALFLVGSSVMITSCASDSDAENHENHEHVDGDEHEHVDGETHEDTDGEMNESTDEIATAEYVCPMHPEETGVEGDSCSKCGMPLELASAEDDHTGHDHE